jgi:hypothetical protein
MTQPLEPQPTATPAPAGAAQPPTVEEQPGVQRCGPLPAPPLPELPGYEVLGELGRGGMGVVYRARHLALKRTVALKMMLAGHHAGAPERGRFRAEAEAVARLSHPNIVQIHEVGEHGDHPFCALEFVPGGSLAQRLAGGPLPAREAARLVEALAGAMQLAHSRNVVHRDLKPANVLLADDGTTKVTDFGLARQLDTDSSRTKAGEVVGTPSYMAPEQAGHAHAVGPAADVYALGAIFYECLTGRPPFEAPTVLETLEQVVSREPVPPRSLNPRVPRDLETVCLRCLRKEPERRYASAQALAEDLRRWRAGEPIQARRVGRLERGLKWVRRNPLVAALLALVALAVASGAAGIYLKYLDAQEQAAFARAQEKIADEKTKLAREKENLAETRRQEAEAALKEKDKALTHALEQLAANAILMAQAAWEKGDATAAQGHLDAVPEKPHKVRNFEWHYLRRHYEGGLFSLHGHTNSVTGVAFSPDGTRLATTSYDRTARLWDTRTGAPVLVLRAHTSILHGVAFSPDGTRLATASHDSTVRLWDVRTGSLALVLRGHRGGVLGVAFSPDGTCLVTAGSDRTARLWVARSGPADAAEIVYRKWVTRPDPDWHAAEADRLDRAGERFAATFHLRRLLDLRPGHLVVLLRGRPFKAAGDSGPLALAACGAALARQPDNAALWLRRALTRSRLGRHIEARADLDRTAALAGEDAVVRLAHFLIEARTGRTPRAERAWEQALRQATVPVLSPEQGLGNRAVLRPAAAHDPAIDSADPVLALEEELGWERRAGQLQSARAVVAGGGPAGPLAAALVLACGPDGPTLPARQGAIAWR